MVKRKSKSSVDSFESSLEQLKAIVSDLEEGNLSLDESLKKYEMGVKHLSHCYRALQTAQQKIEVLVDLDDEGKLTTLPFDNRATEFEIPISKSTDVEENESDADMDDPNVLF